MFFFRVVEKLINTNTYVIDNDSVSLMTQILNQFNQSFNCKVKSIHHLFYYRIAPTNSKDLMYYQMSESDFEDFCNHTFVRRKNETIQMLRNVSDRINKQHNKVRSCTLFAIIFTLINCCILTYFIIYRIN